MSLKFLNIKSGETLIAETEPQIAALWGSSDRGPNANGGQDFGWRLAPAVIVEARKIAADPAKLNELAARYSIPLENVNETVIFNYISQTTKEEDAPVPQEEDFTDAYTDEIRRLTLEANRAVKAEVENAIEHQDLSEIEPTVTTTTTEAVKSIAELEAELEARKVAEGIVDSTTTTTTTELPKTTTTTTTKKK